MHNCFNGSRLQILEKAGLTVVLDEKPLLQQEVQDIVNQVKANLKVIQKQHKKNQDDSLQKCLKEVEEKAKESEDPKAAKKATKSIEAIIWSEWHQEWYDRIKQAIKGLDFSAGLDRLYVPKLTSPNQGTHELAPKDHEILLKMEDIHKALLERNKQQFHQAAETPFGHGFFQDLISYFGLSQAAEDIVSGNFLDKMTCQTYSQKQTRCLLSWLCQRYLRAIW